jgi:tRNA(Ile2) C34 agmatinyltransferase TiaS
MAFKFCGRRLKPAGLRCPLCGPPADERAIEVVHALRLGYASFNKH